MPAKIKKISKQLTIICPVYNEESVVEPFFNRIYPVIQKIKNVYNVNLLFINNASTDNTLEAIEKLHRKYKFIYFITLTTNVGYQRSLECGLNQAKGDVICFIDVDCEDPPEMILDFLVFYKNGYDLIYGIRTDREENKIVKKARNLFYHILKGVADEEVILFMAEFSLMSDEVRNAVIQHKSSFPFIRSYISRVGFRRVGIEYKRQKRIGGKTHYNFWGMTIFAVAGILASSTLPLRLPIYLFPFWFLVSLVLVFYQFNSGNLIFLYVNLMLFFLYFGLTLSFIALYVGRGYKNTLSYPNYFIHKKLSFLQN